MFDNLTERLNRTLKNISGKGRITEDNIKDTLREVRVALLEADVALPVVKSFTQRVKERTLGSEVALSLTPGQEFIKAVHAELVETMGGTTQEINLAHQPPAVILLAGLQGAGKTTSAAKLALYLKERLKKKVLMVSVDTYRPAAMDQLKTLSLEVNVDCYPSSPKDKPEDIAKAALQEAKLRAYDVLIVDTAGRLAVDEEMMDEVKRLHALTDPVETLFVVDAMTGQDAVNVAKSFDETVGLDGVILTKLDGDTRGGAALSIRSVIGKPILYVGMGEKLSDLEQFYPDRMASRILGMGDVLTLIEKAEAQIDVDKAKEMTRKFKKAEFTYDDYLEQMNQVKNMGNIQDLIGMIPGMGNQLKNVDLSGSEAQMKRTESIILSMTLEERSNPDIMNMSRKKRIAAGAGVSINEVNALVKQFDQMKKIMKQFSGQMSGKKAKRGGFGGFGGFRFPF